MKKVFLASLALASALSAGSLLAQGKAIDTQAADTAKKPAASNPKAFAATGVVKQVNTLTGTVTLAHEPVAALGWPAMTMGFDVADKKLFDKLKVGKKVQFEFVQKGNDFAVTAVK